MQYDVIVIGVGSMGSATCYAMAKRGLKVLGLEQFGVVHELGSHSGQSRLVRKAYFEHPDYVPLLQRAYDCWAQIESEASTQLFWKTGIAYFAPPDNEIIKGVKSAAEMHHLHLEQFSKEEARSKWPQFTIPDTFECLFEPDAGFITPEKAIRIMVNLAEKNGAIIQSNERVLNISVVDSGVEVLTTNKSYIVNRVIVTAGAYTSRILSLKIPLKVTSQLLAWTEPINHAKVGLGDMICWMIAEENREGLFYGFPQLSETFEGPKGLKLAYHRAGRVLEKIESNSFDSNAEEALLQGVLDEFMPDIKARISEFKQCRYTYSPDEHFVVDFLPGYDKRVIVAAGFSGHGFKFAPVIGEALADLAIAGQTDLPIDFLGMNRF
jgi:sarcosine oxidase